jgi:hypothetical protein
MFREMTLKLSENSKDSRQEIGKKPMKVIRI